MGSGSHKCPAHVQQPSHHPNADDRFGAAATEKPDPQLAVPAEQFGEVAALFRASHLACGTAWLQDSGMSRKKSSIRRSPITPTQRRQMAKAVSAMRARLGITHRQLGEAAGYTQQASLSWCSGKNQLSVASIYALVAKLGVTADELLGLGAFAPKDDKKAKPKKAKGA